MFEFIYLSAILAGKGSLLDHVMQDGLHPVKPFRSCDLDRNLSHVYADASAINGF
jgi:hypothetical protein